MNEETTTRTNLITTSKLWYATVATEVGLDGELYQERWHDLPFMLWTSTSIGSYSLEKYIHVQKWRQGVGWRQSVSLRHRHTICSVRSSRSCRKTPQSSHMSQAWTLSTPSHSGPWCHLCKLALLVWLKFCRLTVVKGLSHISRWN